jgi:hypothetical protein
MPNPLFAPLEIGQSHIDDASTRIANQTDDASQRITLQVTPQDLGCSVRSGLNNPLLCALERQTGTLWRLYDDGFALEAVAPYRSCRLPFKALQDWHHWQVTGELNCSAWEIELVPTQATDGYSLIQHRRTNLPEKGVFFDADELSNDRAS